MHRPDRQAASGAVDVVVVLPSSVFGGAERTIANLLEGMLQLPSFPRVTVLANAGMFSPHLPPGGEIALVDIAGWGLSTTLNSISGVRQDAGVLAHHIARLKRPGRKTVVLCFLHYGAALAVWLKRSFLHDPTVRIVASPRGPSVAGIPMITHHKRERMLWHAHMALVGRWCDGVVVPSDGMRQELLSRYWASAAKVVAIPNSYPRVLDAVWSVNAERVAADGSAVSRFVMATRLSGEKNIGLAVDAFALHVSRHPSDTLTIVGDGPARDELQRSINSRGLGHCVALHTFQAQPFELMARHDAYIHTCLIEGFGNSMLEALALGLPVVATDCDFGPRQLVMPGVNGLLVPVCNPEALANALSDIKRMPSDRLKLAARASALAYSNFLMAARYVNFFCRV